MTKGCGSNEFEYQAIEATVSSPNRRLHPRIDATDPKPYINWSQCLLLSTILASSALDAITVTRAHDASKLCDGDYKLLRALLLCCQEFIVTHPLSQSDQHNQTSLEASLTPIVYAGCCHFIHRCAASWISVLRDQSWHCITKNYHADPSEEPTCATLFMRLVACLDDDPSEQSCLDCLSIAMIAKLAVIMLR
jgi:hypothetical protein